MLYIFGGLPSCGKSVLSQRLAKHTEATFLRIDAMEQAMKTHGGMAGVTVEAYVAAYAVALDNLRLGRSVIADSVNPIQVTRRAWQMVAAEAGKPFCQIEIICSSKTEHQRRYEARQSDIPGLSFPPWQAVVDREYESWLDADIVIDTAVKTIAESEQELLQKLRDLNPLYVN